MLSFPPAVRIWLATKPTDMRKSFDTLAEVVRQHLHNDPLSGHVFVFRNKRSDRVKLFNWDEDGYVIVYKRLEEGVFHFPAAADGQAGVTLRAAELAMLLYRDGRDVALSLTKVPWMHRDLYVNFTIWLYYCWILGQARRCPGLDLLPVSLAAITRTTKSSVSTVWSPGVELNNEKSDAAGVL